MSKIDQFSYPDSDILEDPYDFYAAMRKDAPVYQEPKSGTYFVSKYEDVAQAVRDTETFSSKRELIPLDDNEINSIRDKGLKDSISLTSHDPPQHQRFRSLVNKVLTVKRFRSLEPKIRTLANRLVDAFIADGTADIHEQFSIPLPLTVIADLLDLDHADLPQLKQWSDDYTITMAAQACPVSRNKMVECAQSLTNLQLYFSRIVDERREKPGDDLISQLLEHSALASQPLDQAELVDILRIFLIGGNETTTLAFSSMMSYLLWKPELYERVRRDPKMIAAAIEETLRLQSPTQWVLRSVAKDTELGGTHMPTGSRVCLLWGSANRDADKFGADAAEFSLDRPNIMNHLSFGYGPHFCAGAPLARLELTIALETFVARLHNLRLAGPEAVRFSNHPLLHGPNKVKVMFDPGRPGVDGESELSEPQERVHAPTE